MAVVVVVVAVVVVAVVVVFVVLHVLPCVTGTVPHPTCAPMCHWDRPPPHLLPSSVTSAPWCWLTHSWTKASTRWRLTSRMQQLPTIRPSWT